MIHLPAYIFAIGFGYLFLRCILKDSKELPLSLSIALSIGLGLGLNAVLSFFVFLIFKTFNPAALLGSSLLALFILILYFRPKVNQLSIKPFKSLISPSKSAIFLYGLFLIFIMNFIASTHPFGEWDAWAMWNMKAKFLAFSDNPLDVILNKLNWHTHPDYPLLLPFMHVWIFSLAQKNIQAVPYITALLFSVGIVLLLYSSLRFLARGSTALLASLILMAHPYYHYLATAQYADVLLAFFLLFSIVTLIVTIQRMDHRMALVSGLSLGIMTFVKNEGIAMASLLTLIAFFYFSLSKRRRQFKKIILLFMAGLLIVSSSTIVFKLFLAPPNQDILPNFSLSNIQSINPQKVSLIGQYFLTELIDKRWLGIWFLLIFLFLAGLKNLFREETKIFTVFFILYFLIIIAIYLFSTNVDLIWWIERSLRRIFFTLLPSLLFLGYFIHRPKETVSQNENA